MLVYTDNQKIKLSKEDNVKTFESVYLDKFAQNLKQLQDAKVWKQSGTGALFTGSSRDNIPDDINTSVEGVAISPDKSEIYYSVTANENSSILAINTDTATERHLSHATNKKYGSLDVNEQSNTIVTSVVDKGVTSHIAVLDLNDNSVRTITSGDCIDVNPSFSKKDNSIFYSSTGLGRDVAQNIVAYDNSVICRYDLSTRNITEFMRDNKSDLIAPRQDQNGNLYYIKRPKKGVKQSSIGSIFLDVILFPFRLLKALFGFLNFFSVAFGGTKLHSTSGNNPAKQKTQDPRVMYIRGNEIKANKVKPDKKDEYGGVVPHNWQLIFKNMSDNTEIVLAKGVGFYTIYDSGVIYTNGRYVFYLDQNGKRKMLHKADAIITEIYA